MAETEELAGTPLKTTLNRRDNASGLSVSGQPKPVGTAPPACPSLVTIRLALERNILQHVRYKQNRSELSPIHD
jgi:hypothetical protein